MEIKEAIQIHGADGVFTAASAGASEDYEPLRSMDLDVSTIDEAEQIGFAVHGLMTAEEKAALYWESQPGSLQANNKNT